MTDGPLTDLVRQAEELNLYQATDGPNSLRRDTANNGGLGTCGTCGSHTLIIGSTWDATHGLYVWVIRCPNGHLLVPIPSNVYTINFGGETP
ncbi:MAG: hypothetical protein JWO11_3535 [Nocardioides sp.]|nr:hypothetical protein [Nocardioides sp.]